LRITLIALLLGCIVAAAIGAFAQSLALTGASLFLAVLVLYVVTRQGSDSATDTRLHSSRRRRIIEIEAELIGSRRDREAQSRVLSDVAAALVAAETRIARLEAAREADLAERERLNAVRTTRLRTLNDKLESHASDLENALPRADPSTDAF